MAIRCGKAASGMDCVGSGPTWLHSGQEQAVSGRGRSDERRVAHRDGTGLLALAHAHENFS